MSCNGVDRVGCAVESEPNSGTISLSGKVQCPVGDLRMSQGVTCMSGDGVSLEGCLGVIGFWILQMLVPLLASLSICQPQLDNCDPYSERNQRIYTERKGVQTKKSDGETSKISNVV